MTQEFLAQLIDVAAGREPADLVIKNCQLVDVGLGKIYQTDIAISQGLIAGIGPDYEGKESLDAQGLFALPGLIDAHIHIESSYLSPEEFARLVVPRGTTTVVADPHEIVNVAGLDGLRYIESDLKRPRGRQRPALEQLGQSRLRPVAQHQMQIALSVAIEAVSCHQILVGQPAGSPGFGPHPTASALP